MGSVRNSIKPVKNDSPADSWPDWTDSEIWQLGTDPDESRWVAENLNDDWHTDEPTPDDVIERQADEAEAQDRYEKGLLF